MITYEQAKRIALSKDKKLNACNEYQTAYYFYDQGAKYGDGGESGVVVFKNSGKTTNLSSFILDYLPESDCKQIKF